MASKDIELRKTNTLFDELERLYDQIKRPEREGRKRPAIDSQERKQPW